jgi:hypothetical protein
MKNKLIATATLTAALVVGGAGVAQADTTTLPDPEKYADCWAQAEATPCWTDNNPADTASHPLSVIVYPNRADRVYVAPPRAGMFRYDIQRAQGGLEQHTGLVNANTIFTLAYGDTVIIESGEAGYGLHVQGTLYR